MPTTSSYGLRYPADADPVTLSAYFKNLADDVETALKFPVAQLYATTVQTLSNGAFTAIDFGGEVVDTHNGHSNTTNPSRWTCPAGWAGYYQVSGVFYITNATGSICVNIRKNGTVVPGSLVRVNSSTVAFDSGISTSPVVVQLAVGDYVQLFGEQISGGSRTTFVGTEFTSGMSVSFLRKV